MKLLRFAKAVNPCLIVGATVAVLAAGCPHVPQEDPALELDLIVADAGLSPEFKGDIESTFSHAQILIYQDVLREDGQQDPDRVLSGADVPELQHPIHIVASYGQLWVCDDVYGAVLFWPSLLGLATGHIEDPAPHVILDGNGVIGEPVFALVDHQSLFVADLSPNDGKTCCGAVHIFVEPFYFHADQAPDRTLTEAATPISLARAGDQLYVADPSQNRVLVYTSVSDLLGSGKDAEPDYIELSGPSWLGLDEQGIIAPTAMLVSDNVLYVATASNMLFTFSPADALEDFQEPDAAIAQTNGAVHNPMAMPKLGDRLFVGNANASLIIAPGKTNEPRTNSVGMAAFDASEGLVDGQLPSVVFDTSNAQMSAVRHLNTAFDVLISATAVPEESIPRQIDLSGTFPVGDVHIHRNAESLQQGRPGDLVLPALKDFAGPLSIDGTFFIEGTS